jgi:glycosyltransferase involved in cell wall biosynthesis
VKVFLTGGDRQGWAMDTDLRLAAAALQGVVDVVDEPSSADAVHSVWPDQLYKRPTLRHLLSRPTVAAFGNDPISLFEATPGLYEVATRWLCVAQSTDAYQKLEALGVRRLRLVPYIADLDSFFPIERGDARLTALRRDLGIPDGAYVIANFQRDTDGADLSRLKPQKGADLFLAILLALARRRGRTALHVLLAGPRRHWIRRHLDAYAIPYSFVGDVTAGDDYPNNILPARTINLLTNLADVVLVTSRWEGGPRAVLETAACARPILSTAVGLARDVLDDSCCYTNVHEAVVRLCEDMDRRTLGRHVVRHRDRLLECHSIPAVARRWAEVYEALEPPGTVPSLRERVARMATVLPGNDVVRRATWKAGAAFGRLRRRFTRDTTITIWGDMIDGPYGGGSQVLKAIRCELLSRGYRVLHNAVEAADGHIMNSVFFNVAKAREVVLGGRVRPRVIHRIDGPVSLYRGRDEGVDEHIFAFNREVASATAYQSYYAWSESVRLGFRAVNPTIIRNACDPRIFHPRASYDRTAETPASGKVRLISTAWSTNPRKGFDVYEFLDRHLDFSRFEYVFVGRSPVSFRHIRLVDALPSSGVADHLREADIYITASKNDPASNALVEAVACGLPIIYADSGGHGEIAPYAGLRFSTAEEIPALINVLLEDLPSYRVCGYLPTMGETVDAYLRMLNL